MDLPSATFDELALCAAGLVLDTFAVAGLAVPPKADLETVAQVDPAFLPRLRDRLHGTPNARMIY